MAYEARAVAAARFGSGVAVAIGLLVLAGWLLDLPPLTSLYLPGPNVKTNAGVSLVAAGLANLLLISRGGRMRMMAGRALAVIPLVVGGLTLSEHVVGWDLGIDQLLATEPAGAYGTVSPNRMGPPASTTFLLLGLAMLLGESRSGRRRNAGLALASFASAIPVLPLLGYAYGFSQLYGIARLTGIALSTAVALFILGLAVLAGRPAAGLTALLCRADEVGAAGRRLLPAAFLLPFVLGWLLVRLMSAGAIDGPFAISAMALVLTAGLTALIWRTSRRLAASLDARLAAEHALTESARSIREADRQKSEFMATLSHELRNPLAPIRFAADLLDAPAPVAARARQTIRRQVQHLTRLVDDLLDLTRISRNKLQLHVSTVPLRDVVHDALDAAASDIERGRHRLERQVPDEPVWLQVDPDRVVQILVNLLNNAVRHTPPGGLIVIGAEPGERDVVIFVRDTGEGLPPGELERVFDSFVQLGESRHGGLGIGLALVKGFTALHGGSVEAHSDGPGLGSEFRVRLPRAEAPHPTVSAQTPLPAPGPQRVLIVDDNRDAADMLGDLLVASGHDVRVVYQSSDVMATASSYLPEVGLLDIGMPGMDGYELARQLRADAATAGMFLVAITGWGQEADRARALAAGFDAHLTKPAEPERLLSLLARRSGQPQGVGDAG